MAPPGLFYRAFDESSQSQFDAEDGFADNLIDALTDHIDWSDRSRTPFISNYSSKSAAFACANGRLSDGQIGVTVAYIDGHMLPNNGLRKAGKLAEELAYEVSDVALDNSETEWIVLYQIPKEAVVFRYFLD